MKEINIFLVQNFLCSIGSGANYIRVENVRMRDPVRRMDVGCDALSCHKLVMRVARWLDVATGRQLNFSLQNVSFLVLILQFKWF